MKALEKDRNRRYETANELARDVERYLHDEPVSACPPSAWYRFGKFARRHKMALVTTALVTLALVAGTALSLWQAIRATAALKAEAQALRDLGFEQQATGRALRALGSGRGKGDPRTLRRLGCPGPRQPPEPAHRPAVWHPGPCAQGDENRPPVEVAAGALPRDAQRGHRCPGPARPARGHGMAGHGRVRGGF